MAIGIYILRNPDFVHKEWMGFVGFQCTNFFIFFFNNMERFLPTFSKVSMVFSAVSIAITFVTMLAVSPPKQSASFAFTDFVNLSGWSSDGIAFFVGTTGINWGYSCLDASTHLVEGIPDPERNIPKALLASVVVGFPTGFPITVALLFCVQDINEVITTPTYVSSIELFNQTSFRK